jgi:hypothetical protein
MVEAVSHCRLLTTSIQLCHRQHPPSLSLLAPVSATASIPAATFLTTTVSAATLQSSFLPPLHQPSTAAPASVSAAAMPNVSPPIAAACWLIVVLCSRHCHCFMLPPLPPPHLLQPSLPPTVYIAMASDNSGLNLSFSATLSQVQSSYLSHQTYPSSTGDPANVQLFKQSSYLSHQTYPSSARVPANV